MRLIDADALIDAFDGSCATASELFEEILYAPTIDAVKVVRCKNCKNRHRSVYGHEFCFLMRRNVAENDFCRYGEELNAET